MNNKLTICRVCGYDYKSYYLKQGKNIDTKKNDFFPWGENGDSPSYDYCDCCGIEFGNQDDDLESVRKERTKWIENGMKWNRATNKNSILYQSPPVDFNPRDQLKNVPEGWL